MSTFIYDSELAQLSSLGFKGKNQCVSLLNRTRGNVEVVAKYLKLKAELTQAKKNGNDIQSIKRAIFDVKKNIPNRGYYEQQEKKVAKKFAKAEKEAQLKTEAEVVQEPLTDPIDVDASPKSAKRAAKELKKQEKKAKRSIERNEKKEAKELAKKLAMIDHLPENINKVFLDGNNMLFVLDILRKKCLNRKMKVAEHLLEEMAREWITKSPELQFCTLIFDDTKTNKMDNKMKVCSARPEYPTSDDALIDWSKKFSDEEKKETAVFTSDRALTLILQENGVQVFKSKAWFKLMRKVVDVEDAKEEDSYDEWSQKWFSQYELNH